MELKFRNYCLVVMGQHDGIKEELLKIAETQPKYLDAKGMLLATFAANIEPIELEEYFKLGGWSFLIFDLDKNSSGVNMANELYHKHLFGHLTSANNDLIDMSNRLIEDIKTTDNILAEITGVTKTTVQPKNKKPMDISKLTNKEKNDLINEILDKGTDNLSEYDIETLTKLTAK